jgi:uncharacterized membrane protein YhaH (DUF805 family)
MENNKNFEEFDIFNFLFSFKGRVSRSEFWYYILAEFITLFIVSFIISFYKMDKEQITLFLGTVSLIFIYPNLAVTAKRAHDFNVSGWLSVITLTPYLGFIFMLIIGAIKGNDTENQYGFPKKKL